MGKVTEFHGRRAALATLPTAPSAGAHRLPGVVGDSLAAEIADRVLAKSSGYVSPSKTDWKLDPYQLAVSIIEVTSARWRHDQPWIFVRRRYVEGGSWISPIAMKIAATFAQKDPLRMANTVSATVSAILGVSPKGALGRSTETVSKKRHTRPDRPGEPSVL